MLGDAAHAATASDHNPNRDGVVCAIDITNDPAHGLVSRALAEALVASRDPRLTYLISNGQMVRSYPKTGILPWTWAPYTGKNAHRQHAHISVSAVQSLYDDTRPWRLPPKIVAPSKPPVIVAPPAVIPKTPNKTFPNIMATMFGGVADPNNSAYDNHFINDRELGVALPARFKGLRPKVKVTYNGKSVICDIVDIGPWSTDDPYWELGTRPQAESGRDKKGRRTNLAGLDLTPAADKAIGLNGKGRVDWEFVQ